MAAIPKIEMPLIQEKKDLITLYFACFSSIFDQALRAQMLIYLHYHPVAIFIFDRL